MSTQNLTELPYIQYTGMDYQTMINEIQAIINDNPNWKENWPTFYNSEAGTMFIQLFAWIADNLSLKQDLFFNEMFISTVGKDENKIRLLNLINYIPKYATAATVYLTIELSQTSTIPIVLTPGKTKKDSLFARTDKILKISGQNTDGGTTNYEILKISDNGKPDYIGSVIVQPEEGDTVYTTDSSGAKITALEGETHFVTFYSQTSDGPYFDLEVENLVDNSIRIYDMSNEKEHYQVTNFLAKEAKSDDYGVPYVLEYSKSGATRIRYASTDVISKASRRFTAGGTIGVFYRTCSGSKGNIPRNFINVNKQLPFSTGGTIGANIYNENIGVGGYDAESLDNAVKNGPLSIRTMERAVTPSDYDIILGNYGNMFKCKSYSSTNAPDGFYEYYGRYINPQEVFSFVILNKNYESVPSSQYNNFPWIELKLNNMFNEQYVFDQGTYNYQCSHSDLYNSLKFSSNGTNYSYASNAIIININNEFNASVGSLTYPNNNLKLKLDIKKSDEVFFGNIEMGALYDLIFEGDDEEILETSKDAVLYSSSDLSRRSLTANTNARFISPKGIRRIDVEGSVHSYYDCYNFRYLKFCLDGKQGIVVDLLADKPDNYTGTTWYLTLDENEYDRADNETKAIYNTRLKVDGLTDAIYRRSIKSLIEDSISQLKVENSNEEWKKFSLYDENCGIQFFGLNYTSTNVNLTHINASTTIQFELEIYDSGAYNRYFYGISVSSNNTIDGIVNTLNGRLEQLETADSIPFGFKMYDLDTGEAINSGLTLDNFKHLKNIRFGYSALSKHDNLNISDPNNEINYLSYDMFICSTDKSVLVPDEKGNKILKVLRNNFYVTTQSGESMSYVMPDPIPAASYSNVVSVYTYEDYDYLQIKSPIRGTDSSIFFEFYNIDNSRDIMSEVFGISYQMNNGQYSYAAYGVRSLTLMLEDAISVMDGNSNSALRDTIVAGNVIAEFNSINLPPYITNFFASYKLNSNSQIQLGSIYENYYFNGDSADDELKPELVGLLGQSVDGGMTDDKRFEFTVDDSKSDYIIKMTKDPVDINSIYAIESDVEAIPMDLIKIPTVQILTDPHGADLIFSMDDASPETFNNSVENQVFIATVNELSQVTNGLEFTELLRDIIDGKEALGEIESIVNNSNSVVSNSITLSNQVIFSNLTKNDNSNITFYSRESDAENVKSLFQSIFGTSKTNPELYKLYPKRLFPNNTFGDDSEFYYAPTPQYPLRFTYRKLVDGVSKPADYFITSAESSDKSHAKYYTFYLNKTEDSNFQDTPFYIHMVNDRTYEVDNDSARTVLEEDILQDYMYKYKISGMDIVFLRPYFKTFDIQADIIYDRNFSLQQIQEEIGDALDKNFNLESAQISKSIYKSKIYKVLCGIDGVQSVNLNYFGPDYENKVELENSNVFEAKFYEILVIHEDVTGKHGAIINYEVDDSDL